MNEIYHICKGACGWLLAWCQSNGEGEDDHCGYDREEDTRVEENGAETLTSSKLDQRVRFCCDWPCYFGCLWVLRWIKWLRDWTGMGSLYTHEVCLTHRTVWST